MTFSNNKNKKDIHTGDNRAGAPISGYRRMCLYMREFYFLDFFSKGKDPPISACAYLRGYTVITSKWGEVNYSVQANPESRKITLHVDHMKHYKHETPLNWLKETEIGHGITESTN